MERASRLVAAIFVLAGGLIHLQLWRSGYRHIPYIGPLFLANTAASALVGVAVLVRNDPRMNLAGIALAVSSLGALVMSRTVGLLGFTEPSWTHQAVRATTAELGAIVALALLLRMRQRRLRTPGRRAVVPVHA